MPPTKRLAPEDLEAIKAAVIEAMNAPAEHKKRRSEIVTTEMRSMIVKVLEGMIQKFAFRLSDPNYQPSPTDVIGTMNILKGMEDLSNSHRHLISLLQDAKNEMQQLESKLLGFLQSS